MSLINRMLSDLEERRGGNLRNVDHAIDGLRATPVPTTRRKKRIPPATLAAGLLITGLTALCANLFVSRPPAIPVAQAPAASVVPGAEQATAVQAQPAPATPAVAVTPQAVLITDTATPAAQPVAVAAPPAAPSQPVETPAAPARPPPPQKAALPEPEPEAAPPQPRSRQRMLSKASTEEQQEPLVETARSAPARPERPPAESSFHIAEAAPASATDEALAMLEQGDTAGAEALLREGLENAPGDSAMARVLGHILLARNDARGAVQVLRPAAPTAASDPEYNALLAAAEQRSGAHAQAIRRYRGLLEQNPDNGAWLVGLGISLQSTGEAKAAADAFLRALADPALPAPLHTFAMQQSTQVRGQQP
jgi:MSHA biogenesis protein MshN